MMANYWITLRDKVRSANTVAGKCLIVIKDHNSRYPHITIFVQSVNGGQYARDSLSECINYYLLHYLNTVLSKRQKALPDGATIRLSMSCSIQFSQDHEGEWDSDLVLRSVRTLREQLPSTKLRKRWKLYDKQVAGRSIKETQPSVSSMVDKVREIGIELERR